MSAVGSIGSTSAERLQMLLLQQALSASGTSAAKSAQTDATTSSGASEGTSNSKGMAALQKMIEEAIAAALASLDKSSSAEEVMKAVKNAIDSTLQANGIQPGPPQGGSGPPPANGQVPPAGGPPPGSGSGGDLGSTIDRLLKEAGFDPDKIKSELMQQMAAATGSTASSAATMTLVLQIPLSGGVDTQA